MTEYKLTVWGHGFLRGIWYFETEEALQREKMRWEADGWRCEVEVIE